MSKKKISVHMFKPGIVQEHTILLGERLIKLWKIPTNRPLQLAFGSFRQEIIVSPIPKFTGMRISTTLSSQMGIHSAPILRISYNAGSRTLRIGPLIGVMISRDYPDTPDKPFGSISLFCRELVNACKKQGAYVYFFTPDQINPNHSTIQGWIYDNGWRVTEMPIADVVNNRLTSRKLENKSSVQHFMKEVKSLHGGHVFNEKFLDKTEVFDYLKQNSSLTRFMPESYSLNGYEVLKKMCTRYPVVFLKPVRGSLGKGIIRISKQPNGTFHSLSTSVGGTHRQIYANLPKLFSGISGKMKSTRYQIQQGLNLIDHGKRPVDFRALVQKNGSGKWNITSIVARIAGGNHFVSNLARGGSLSNVKEAVNKSNMPLASKNSAYANLHQAALQIATGLDTLIPEHFGELGIDLAMDTTGRIWLLEVNSKPSKNDNTPLNEQKIRPSVRQLIQYCCYLSDL
ncbi:glutathione synthase/RimK-type ligase-like ATP-grasp enzyme [Paenibacillus sp. DS2015]|uniref:YheC/YheD family endospore coat-associated protein n=1 Tax=Paenibacillus sp. DS2015 TaxID=3373917 RepID=UPI003D1BCEC5